MTLWDDTQDSFIGDHRYADGLSWSWKQTGLAVEGVIEAADPASLINAVLGWWGDMLRSAALTEGVGIELLLALVATETAEAMAAEAASYVATVDGYVSDDDTPDKVFAGLTALRLSIAREVMGLPGLTHGRLAGDPAFALQAAARHIAAHGWQTNGQPPLVAAGYNQVTGPMFSATPAFRLASYNGDGERIWRMVKWFNAAVAVVGSDASNLAGTSPSYAVALAGFTWPQQPGPPPPPVIGQWGAMRKDASVAALDAGMATLCDHNPDLSAVWSLDQVTTDQIGAVARDFSAGMGLPLGMPVFAYPDRNQRQHVMSGPEVVVLYQAMRDFIAAIRMFDVDRAPGLPGQPVYLP